MVVLLWPQELDSSMPVILTDVDEDDNDNDADDVEDKEDDDSNT